MQLSKLASALDLAIQAHQGQVRKSTTIPYISHPMAVASIALEFGGIQEFNWGQMNINFQWMG